MNIFPMIKKNPLKRINIEKIQIYYYFYHTFSDFLG